METGVHQPQVQLRRPQVFPQHLATPELAEGAPAHCPRSRSAARRASSATAPRRQPTYRSCCCPPTEPAEASIHSTSPVSKHHSRVVAGLLPVAWAGRVHQRRFPFQHPFTPQFRVGTEVGLVGKEYLGSRLLRLIHQGRVLCYKGLPLLRIRLEQTFLGPLEGESRPVQTVTSPRT